MISFLNNYFNYNHFFISGILTVYLIYLYFNIKNLDKMISIIKVLLIFNFVTFYGYLLYFGDFNYRVHLQLHLCYITEFFLFLSLIFKTKILYPWIVLNGLGGGITGFTNSNLPPDSLLIENIHLHLSHFNLLLFTLIAFKMKLVITTSSFLKSILLNLFIFSFVVWFNIEFGSNYWFTMSRPPGTNLALLFSDWPYYLYGLIIIGIISYCLTFKLFSRNISK